MSDYKPYLLTSHANLEMLLGLQIIHSGYSYQNGTLKQTAEALEGV